MMLSIDSEGHKAAHWLADHGIAAFVLKYRVAFTPSDPKAFGKEFAARMAALVRDHSGSLPMVEDGSVDRAVEDGAASLAYVRAHADRYGVDPQRVGMIGFSAGARTTLGVTLSPDPGCRPSFSGLIYGPMTAVHFPSDAPPVFIAVAGDDLLYGKESGLFESWIAAKRPVELHRYERGGHGFGMARMGTTSDHWIDEFYWWLEARRLLKPPVTSTPLGQR